MTTYAKTLRAATFAIAALTSQAVWAAGALQVLKSPTCGCCTAWSQHMRDAGFAVTETNVSDPQLDAAKQAAGLKPGQTSCHTANIEGYVIEGHVPAKEVKRLLAEKPDALGLTVPDMPYGSPGMGDPADAEPYDVLLVKSDGTTEVFASYR